MSVAGWVSVNLNVTETGHISVPLWSDSALACETDYDLLRLDVIGDHSTCLATQNPRFVRSQSVLMLLVDIVDHCPLQVDNASQMQLRLIILLLVVLFYFSNVRFINEFELY